MTIDGTGSPAAPSLKWRLIRRLMLLQAVILTVLILLLIGALWATGYMIDDSDENVVDVLQGAVARDAGGNLTLRPTPEMDRLRAGEPRLWYIIRDRAGHVLTAGAVPPEYAAIGDALDRIDQARLGWQLGDQRPNARLKRVETEAGTVQILTGTGGRLQLRKLLLSTGLIFLTFVLPGLAIMCLATLAATPLVVRRALAGLSRAAAQAERIDVDQRGARLPMADVPAEIRPLVKAVNDALGRLDDGYERQKRFLADAAHELRTPIAILNTRLESLPESPAVARLLADVARLAVLAEQLLDLQRLNQRRAEFQPVDLVALGERVAADLAPLAIAAGYELAFDAPSAPVTVMGDRIALERAVVNLVQNAIDHGGDRGTIGITVGRDRSIEIADDGEGVPADQRERIFEPFHRLQPRDRGAGLGLNLVQEIIRLHRGQVAVLDGPQGGAVFRLALPAPDTF